MDLKTVKLNSGKMSLFPKKVEYPFKERQVKSSSTTTTKILYTPHVLLLRSVFEGRNVSCVKGPKFLNVQVRFTYKNGFRSHCSHCIYIFKKKDSSLLRLTFLL